MYQMPIAFAAVHQNSLGFHPEQGEMLRDFYAICVQCIGRSPSFPVLTSATSQLHYGRWFEAHIDSPVPQGHRASILVC